MDQLEHQSLSTTSQFIKSKFRKKLTQLLLSLLVFSILLSSSWRSLLFVFKFDFSTIPLQLFTHTIDKNCIFLICNGLLVFVTKYSGLISSSPKYEHNNIESFKDYEDERRPLVLNSKEPLLEKQGLVDTIDAQENVTVVQKRENEATNGQEENKGTKKCIAQDEGGGEREGGFLIVKEGKETERFVWEHNQDGGVEESDAEFPLQQQEEEEEEEEEEENGPLGAEELNKKFEEFIRKMKEELRMEPQQQLIMVE